MLTLTLDVNDNKIFQLTAVNVGAIDPNDSDWCKYQVKQGSRSLGAIEHNRRRGAPELARKMLNLHKGYWIFAPQEDRQEGLAPKP